MSQASGVIGAVRIAISRHQSVPSSRYSCASSSLVKGPLFVEIWAGAFLYDRRQLPGGGVLTLPGWG